MLRQKVALSAEKLGETQQQLTDHAAHIFQLNNQQRQREMRKVCELCRLSKMAETILKRIEEALVQEQQRVTRMYYEQLIVDGCSYPMSLFELCDMLRVKGQRNIVVGRNPSSRGGFSESCPTIVDAKDFDEQSGGALLRGLLPKWTKFRNLNATKSCALGCTWGKDIRDETKLFSPIKARQNDAVRSATHLTQEGIWIPARNFEEKNNSTTMEHFSSHHRSEQKAAVAQLPDELPTPYCVDSYCTSEVLLRPEPFKQRAKKSLFDTDEFENRDDFLPLDTKASRKSWVAICGTVRALRRIRGRSIQRQIVANFECIDCIFDDCTLEACDLQRCQVHGGNIEACVVQDSSKLVSIDRLRSSKVCGQTVIRTCKAMVDCHVEDSRLEDVNCGAGLIQTIGPIRGGLALCSIQRAVLSNCSLSRCVLSHCDLLQCSDHGGNLIIGGTESIENFVRKANFSSSLTREGASVVNTANPTAALRPSIFCS